MSFITNISIMKPTFLYRIPLNVLTNPTLPYDQQLQYTVLTAF